jgi:uncharacterized membrane protein YjjB (DUF3815 family)
MLNDLLQFGAAAVATVCFGILFQVSRRHFAACGITGAVGWLAYLLCAGPAGFSPAMATFMATLPLTALSRWFAIRHRAPVTIFLLCGIFPLVPGAGIYDTAYYFLRDDRAQCVSKGAETIKIALAIALGIALVASIPLPHRLHVREQEKK